MRRRRRASSPTKHWTPGGTCASRCVPFIDTAPVASGARAAAIAASAASVIASTGAGTPVQASNCPTACATSISTPSIVTQPRARRGGEERRLARLVDHVEHDGSRAAASAPAPGVWPGKAPEPSGRRVHQHVPRARPRELVEAAPRRSRWRPPPRAACSGAAREHGARAPPRGRARRPRPAPRRPRRGSRRARPGRVEPLAQRDEDAVPVGAQADEARRPATTTVFTEPALGRVRRRPSRGAAGSRPCRAASR